MGYQNMNDNGQMQANVDRNAKSSQRLSNTARLAQDTTHAQYKRLTDSGLPVVPTGDQVGRGTI